MRLLAALAVIGALGFFGARFTPASAQVYPPPDNSLLCETGVEFIVQQGVGTVTVTVLDLNTNQPVPNVQVIFTTTGGTLNPLSDVTDQNGIAETVLDPGSVTDPLTVTASLEDTSCQSRFQQLATQADSPVSQTLSEVAVLPATGSDGAASGGSSQPWALAALAMLGLVALVTLGRRVASR